MAWQSQSSNAGAFFWSASSFIIASVELSLAVLVFFSSVITFLTSSFIRLSGLQIPCSCLVYHLEQRSKADEEVLRQRSCAREKSGRSDSNSDFYTGEASFGSDVYYNSSCAQVEEILPTDLRRKSCWKETGANEARLKPMELTNAAESEAAEEDGDQLHAKQSWDNSREPELEEQPQTEREALAAMYLELEKERNASATAANEAMGMIARLQEEKAAVLMEARQFQRMVDQKSMHDQEAIEALRDVIAKIEEEKRELEEENKFYRLRLLRAQIEETIHARRIENQMLLLTAPSSEERRLQKSASSKSMGEESVAASAKDAEARIADEEQWRLRGRTIKSKKHIPGPTVRGESPETGTPRLEDSSIIPSKTSNVNATAKVSELGQARTDADIGGERSKASLPGLGSSRIDTATCSPSVIANKKKQYGKAALAKPEKCSEAENTPLRRRLSSHRPSDTAPESLDKGRGVSDELSDRALEERRLSVLEYVWKLEEELHQQAGRRPTPIGRSKSGVSRSNTQSPVEGTRTSETATKAATMMSAMPEDDPLWQRVYEDRNFNERNLDAFSSVEGDGDVTHGQHSHADEDENKERQQEAGTSMQIGEETVGQSSDEVLFEHDIYEVQEPPYEPQGVAGDSSRPRHVNSDRLGKPDLLSSLDEDIRDRNQMEYVRDDFTVPLYEAGSSGTDIQWEELYWRAWKGDPHTHSKIRRHQAWTSVEDEVQQLTLRLEALEADRHLMKQTIDSLTREHGGLKLLQEIAQQLRELRGTELEGLQQQDLLSDTSSFQVDQCMVKKRRFNGRPRGSSCRLGMSTSHLHPSTGELHYSSA